nr:PREDICTED: exocyst complex component 3 [Anolis carolinensis]|eukprot:XP_008122693.2 PREDICTED: exocyst complex component 3 [Anolis carolinensis]
MPVLKNPYKAKMANGDSAGGTLILDKEGSGPNPFEEDLEENERAALPPPKGDRRSETFSQGLFNGSPEERFRRRATLERLVGLSPFRMGKGKKKSPGEKGLDRRSFLGRMMTPLVDGKPRRSSEDFSLLQRFNGRRKEPGLYASDCGLAEKENGGDAMKRFLKIGLGAKGRRPSLVEKLNQTETVAEAETVAEEAEAKAKEPLSVLEILGLIQKRDLLVADEHIIELEAECEAADAHPPTPEGEANKDGSRKAKDVALLYEALQKELWSVLAEALASKSAPTPLEMMVRVIDQEEEADRKWTEAKVEVPARRIGGRPRAMRRRWAEAVGELVQQRLSRCLEGQGRPTGPLVAQMDRLAKAALEDLCTVKFHLLHAYPKDYQAFGVYLCGYHQGLAHHLAQAVQRSLTISELYFVLDWNSNIYQREVLGRAEISSLVKGHDLGPLLPPETQFDLEEECIAKVKDKIIDDMDQALQKEEETWAQESEGDGVQIGLSSKVIMVRPTRF